MRLTHFSFIMLRWVQAYRPPPNRVHAGFQPSARTMRSCTRAYTRRFRISLTARITTVRIYFSPTLTCSPFLVPADIDIGFDDRGRLRAGRKSFGLGGDEGPEALQQNIVRSLCRELSRAASVCCNRHGPVQPPTQRSHGLLRGLRFTMVPSPKIVVPARMRR